MLRREMTQAYQLILEVALKDLRPGDVLETLAAGMQWKVGVRFRLTLLWLKHCKKL